MRDEMLRADSLLRDVRIAYSGNPQPNLPETVSTLATNPRNEQATVHVTVSRPLDGQDVEALGDPARWRIAFELPGGMEAGKSVTRAYATRQR